MPLDKELALGIFNSSKKNKVLNISWNTGTTVVTGYSPFPSNENDRPRINTWRSDATYVTFMSAGSAVWNPATSTFSSPWGDRRIETQQVTIPLYSNLSCGIDFFTDSRLPLPTFIPSLTMWVSSSSVPGETKWQYTIPKRSKRVHDISVIFSATPAAPRITNISYNTNPEIVTITNLGGTSQDMTGWYLISHTPTLPLPCNQVAGQKFTFPNGFTLAAGQSVEIQSDSLSINNPPAILDWTNSSIWNNAGDGGTLYDSSSAIVDVYFYGTCLP